MLWGIQHPRNKFSQQTIDMAKTLIEDMRGNVIISEEMYKGSRFNDSNKLLEVLESNMTEQEFLANLESSVVEVLQSAARTDYYYAWEKQW